MGLLLRDEGCRLDRALVDDPADRPAERAVEVGPPRGTMGGAAEAGDGGKGASPAAGGPGASGAGAGAAGPGAAEAAGADADSVSPSPRTRAAAAASRATLDVSAATAQRRLGRRGPCVALGAVTTASWTVPGNRP
ncbi:hypothetical protein [Actinomycetospora sp. TBRC 11914]|uniref:hypothetical protein n=1 Tax=Actinomycetospora sp. TBRC 11914 TaxID=2729387 RepID=UPI00145E69CE|nr:hypothetical protein [Actinomycetospora sp. TBRC 11914]NMO92339.1 hypothetical protein [Actinomycetospora sp. TBRC 11914]